MRGTPHGGGITAGELLYSSKAAKTYVYVIGHGNKIRYTIMVRLAKARCWSKR